MDNVYQVYELTTILMCIGVRSFGSWEGVRLYAREGYVVFTLGLEKALSGLMRWQDCKVWELVGGMDIGSV